jgi:hypothetical protein
MTTQKLAGYNRQSNVEVVLAEAMQENDVLRESFEQATAALLALRSEDEGFAPLNKLKQEDGFSLDSLQEIAKLAELQTTGNPLLKRGLTLRTSNVFGRGVNFQGAGTEPRFKKIVERPINQKALFTEVAFDKNERALFTAGNLFMAYRRSSKTFYPIPFDEITNSASNPDLVDDVWFYQRSWTETDILTGQPKVNPTVRWYPVLEHWEDEPTKLPKNIANAKVDPDVIIIDMRVNTSIGKIWGVPDCLPAMPYAWAHAEYIRDASKLLKALSTIAWKVVSKSKANAQTAAAKQANQKGAANTAVMTEGTDLTAMPRSGQVDMADGQTIASYVAAALEVSVIALLSDPGSASGSYGAAATLDGPTANSARSRQKLWADFYKRIYRAMGVKGEKEVVVDFPKIAEDPIYRTVQTLQIAFAFGGIWQDEFRAAVLEATDVVPLHDGVPEPTVFTSAAQFSVEAQQEAERKEQATAAAAEAAAKAKNVQGRGRADGVGASAGNNDLRDSDATPGTGS